jgi:hypothetical protein
MVFSCIAQYRKMSALPHNNFLKEKTNYNIATDEKIEV